MVKLSRYFSDYYIASFTLVFMSVQFLFIEGWAISIPKVVFMACTPFLLIARSPYISKAAIFSLLYWTMTVSINVVQFGAVERISTFYYTALFLVTFTLYYNLIYINKAFHLEQFLRLVRTVIIAYALVLVFQQIFFLVGLRYMPIINLMAQPYYGLFHLNSLAIEPSHAARILSVYFYAYLKLSEYKLGAPPQIQDLWKRDKKLLIVFLYAMFGLGSGTAMVALCILSLYFVRRNNAVYVIIVGAILFMGISMIDYEPAIRFINIFKATLTGDVNVVTQVDNSAAARVNIILNTIKNLDISEASTWLGNGIDSTDVIDNPVVSAISDYGLISYILKLILFFTCCFTGFFTLEIVMFILLFSFNIGNIAYGWATLMVLSTVRYFKYHH